MWLLCLVVYGIMAIIEPIQAEKSYWDYQQQLKDYGLRYNEELDERKKSK